MALLSKQSHEYTKDQKEFALTLHLHGPKAYNYLRKKQDLNLPHPTTLRRYYIIYLCCLIAFINSPSFNKISDSYVLIAGG